VPVVDAKGVLAKVVAAALIADGFKMAFDKSLKVDEDELIKKANNNTFGFMCGSTMYDKTFPVKLKKRINAFYNRRPDNVYGDYMRILLLDSAHREGIDAFDVKHLHILQDLPTEADRKQAIGRATRLCGQKGLVFSPTKGWPLEVYIYDASVPSRLHESYGAQSLSELHLKQSKIDLRLLKFAPQLNNMIQDTAVDRVLTENVHHMNIASESSRSSLKTHPITHPTSDEASTKESHHSNNSKASNPSKASNEGGGKNNKNKNKRKKMVKGHPVLRPKPPLTKKNLEHMNQYIEERFSAYKWPEVTKLENKCGYDGPEVVSPEAHELETSNSSSKSKSNSKDASKSNAKEVDSNEAPGSVAGPEIVKFTPSQDFARTYFQPPSAYKGLFLYHGVGCGKTCTSIAVATTGWEPSGYTILYVTRTALRSDVYKNMFDQVCSLVIKQQIRKGLKLPVNARNTPSKFLSNNWFLPISMKQFSNLCSGKNKLYHELVKRNGKEDPLKKTLVILDEAHKLYAKDIVAAERPNTQAIDTAVHHSYDVSGKDSVRLLIMTATPFSSDPMDMMRLMNLMRPTDDLLETDFEKFAKEYLKDDGTFSETGGNIFANKLTGYISYLNREHDKQQFAYPVIHNIVTPMSETVGMDIDESAQENKIEGLKNKVQEVTDTIKAEKQRYKDEVKRAHAQYCSSLPVKERKACKDEVSQKVADARDKRLTTLADELENAKDKVKAAEKELKQAKKDIVKMKKEDVSQETMLKTKCKI